MGSVAQEFTPHKYPPFPSGLPSVELETFSLRDLENDNQEVQDQLFETCRTRGFFYLDFAGSEAASLPPDATDIAVLAEQVFALPIEEKRQYGYTWTKSKTIFGYKEAGRTVADKKGTRDTAEFFNIAKDEMLPHQPMQLAWPEVILNEKSLLARYMTAAHKTGLKILSTFESRLGLPSGTLAKLHRIEQRAGDHARMTRGPPRKSQNPDDEEIQSPGHTDFGTITILFNWLGGLQVWSAPSRGETRFSNVIDPTSNNSAAVGHKDQWLWVVPPKPSCAIVNLGDAAVKFTNGILCSGRHRVVPAPGVQGVFPRYSIVYFVRPEDNIKLKRLEGSAIPPLKPGEVEEDLTAQEWIVKQAEALRAKPPSD